MNETQQQSDAFQLKDLWDVVKKRRWVVATFFGVLVLVVLIGTLSRTEIFRASTTVAILPDTPNVVNFQEVENLGASNYFLYQDYYNTQLKILKSRTVARGAIDRLGLTQEGPEGAPIPMEPQTLVQHLDIDPIKESQLIKISYNDPDPEQAALIANTVAEVYIEENLNQRVEITKQAVTFLSQRLTELKKQIVRSESKVFEFKSENNVVGWDEKHNLVLQKLIDLNQAFSKSHTERLQLQARTARLGQLLAAGEDREAILPVIESNLIQHLKQRLVELERERSELSARYKEAHPKMLRISSQLRSVDGRLDSEVGKILAATRNEYLLKKAEAQSLGEELEKAKREALELNRKMISHSALQQEADKNQQLYDILLGRLKETDITSNLRSNNIRVIDSADVPDFPVKPDLPLNMALSIMLGLFGGIGLAFFFDYLDNTLKTQEDVERYLKLPVLGVVPSIEPDVIDSENRDLYVHTHPKSTISESVRAVRTSLQFLGATQDLSTLLVTSATPLEGKSTTCCNLGISMAQMGERVVLVDTDLRRSRLHKTFRLPNERGFSNLLLGSDDVHSVLQKTDIPNLWVIPSGPLPPNPSELLGSERMDSVLKLLKARFDRVIFDSPPVIAVTDAILVSAKVSGTIFVAKSGKVSRELAVEARRRLVDVQTNVLGVVLNDVDVHSGGYAYEYAYYYGTDNDDIDDRKAA